MKVSDLIKELQLLDGDAEIKSIGTYSGIDKSADYCIHTNKGNYDIGKKEGRENHVRYDI